MLSLNYKEWLSYWIKGLGANCSTAKDIFLETGPLDSCVNIILRHDIDSCTDSDVKIIKNMSKIQESFGVRGSYYLLLNHNYYDKNKDLFLEMQEKGHEIGFHIDLSFMFKDAKPSEDSVVDAINSNLETLKSDGFDILTAAWHGAKDNINARILLGYSESKFVSYIQSDIEKLPFLTDCCYFLTTKKSTLMLPEAIRQTYDDLSEQKSALVPFFGKTWYYVLHPCSGYYKEDGADLLYAIDDLRYWEDDPSVSSGYKEPQSLSELFLEKRRVWGNG